MQAFPPVRLVKRLLANSEATPTRTPMSLPDSEFFPNFS